MYDLYCFFFFLSFFHPLLVYLVFKEYVNHKTTSTSLFAILVRTGTLMSRAANWIAVMIIVVGRSCLL